ncbi:helix-turn-helix transcriptional regulator [Oceanobacillus neutriphilus]|uniref:Transcriptional regulator n=1 Tax=Oceanobacillus neutriphilus TaxID=531815 RepID=A0ABQ2P1F7_9BACI|nr:YafY family protein [Oceanobacillus neutriphilus]GGP15937.1 transcriptional regulator [Oceanobacillus neutriphilus]
MKLERLMYILIALLSQKRIIAKETAEKFQVSVRTIYRDIDTLTLAGIPIYSERGNNGGFFLAEKYKMNASLFTEEEQKFIKNISRNINRMIRYPSVDMLEKKMDSYKSDNPVSSHYFFDFNSWNLDSNNLDRIDAALHQKRLVEFVYTSKKKQTKRTVVPYHLIFKMNAWYLLGFCLEKEALRFFKLSRIRDLEMTEVNFDESLHKKLSYQELEKMIDPERLLKKEIIRLTFSLDAAAKVYDYFQAEEITEQENNLLVAAQRIINQELVDLLLSFGNHVKILGPSSLQTKIITILQKNLGQYDNT